MSIESVRCPYRDCRRVHLAEVWAAVTCPQCARVARGRPIRLETDLESRRRRDTAEVPDLDGAVLLLEDIRSLWNVGNMLRTADGLGVRHVFLCGITGTPQHDSIHRTALGAETVVPWSYAVHPFEALEMVRLAGLPVLALETLPQSMSLYRASALPAFCLVVGNEPDGVSPEVIAESDLVVHIPMRGLKESLNVTVACGIALFALTKA